MDFYFPEGMEYIEYGFLSLEVTLLTLLVVMVVLLFEGRNWVRKAKMGEQYSVKVWKKFLYGVILLVWVFLQIFYCANITASNKLISAADMMESAIEQEFNYDTVVIQSVTEGYVIREAGGVPEAVNFDFDVKYNMVHIDITERHGEVNQSLQPLKEKTPTKQNFLGWTLSYPVQFETIQP